MSVQARVSREPSRRRLEELLAEKADVFQPGDAPEPRAVSHRSP